MPRMRRSAPCERACTCGALSKTSNCIGRKKQLTRRSSYKLILEMSVADPMRGAPRTHGEPLKLGIDVGQTTRDAEIMRLQGRCLLLQGTTNVETDAENYKRALDIARRQCARALELCRPRPRSPLAKPRQTHRRPRFACTEPSSFLSTSLTSPTTISRQKSEISSGSFGSTGDTLSAPAWSLPQWARPSVLICTIAGGFSDPSFASLTHDSSNARSSLLRSRIKP